MKIARIHIGEEIRKEVERKKMSNSKFGKFLNIQRQNVSKQIFEKESIDTNILSEICEILNVRFFDFYVDTENCNEKKLQSNEIKEVKAQITLQIGQEKREETFSFMFGKDN